MTPNELFNKHLPLVGWCYKRYINDYQHEWMEDILQEGRLALWTVCQKFDETKGYRFATYAVPFIGGKMRQYHKYHTNVIKMPRKAFEGDTDTFMRLNNVVSLDANIEQDDGGNTTLGDIIPGVVDNSEFITEDLIDSFIATIDDDTHRNLMEEYYYNNIWGLGLTATQLELAEKYGISQAQCSRIIKRYNDKFSKYLNN